MAPTPFFNAVCTSLSFVAFVFSTIAVFLPYWGYFGDFSGNFGSDHGYFSPWSICRELSNDRQKCGEYEYASRFRPSNFVFISGVAIIISAISLGVYCIIAVAQFVLKQQTGALTTVKLCMGVTAALSTLASPILFACQTDDLRRGFEITKGFTFYLVVINVALAVFLGFASWYEYMEANPQRDEPRAMSDLNEGLTKRRVNQFDQLRAQQRQY